MFEKFKIKKKNKVYNPAPKKIVFLHIPKCGGTSIQKAIEKYYFNKNRKEKQTIHLDNIASFKAGFILSEIHKKEMSNGILVDDYYVLKLREYLLLFYLCQNSGFINGHFPFSNSAYEYFHKDYVFITFIRDPVKRWISEYLYNRFKKSKYRKIDLEIDDYLKTKYSLAQGYQFVKFLGGASEDEDYTSSNAIERAKKNIHKIGIVGFLEDQEGFTDNFFKYFGKKLTIEHLNKNPLYLSESEKLITKEIMQRMQRIEAICRPDLEVYHYALENFSKH